MWEWIFPIFLVWLNWFYLFCISVEDGKAVLDHLLTWGTRQLSFVHLKKTMIYILCRF